MKRFLSFSRHSFGVRNRSPWGSMLAHTLHQFHENDLFTSAAAMSYFGLMALFPALLLMLAISNKLAAGSELLTHAVDVYPGSSKFLRDTIASFSDLGIGAIVSCVIIVLWAGSWVFAVAERALNRIWGAISRTFWHGRALTIGMIGMVGLLLSLSVLVTSALVALREIASRFSPRQIERYTLLTTAGSAFWQVLFAIGSYLITVALMVLVYRFMPRAAVTLRDTLPGAFLAGLLWELAKYIFAWSLGYLHYDQIYGAVGAVVAVLTWGYMSSLIMLFGAQLTAVFHREHPSATEQHG
ncbi:MAG TPA: YihY/virulence factor BrkB family protein [Pyrinomonadaceae bacterium]|nr:YihY/virulence factor BrkB family protein [Pyrinomonadaceae bacterium]HLM23848.1 YihY/virulence factor BrkB family protein [Pyrinomonadaceae bacterium]